MSEVPYHMIKKKKRDTFIEGISNQPCCVSHENQTCWLKWAVWQSKVASPAGGTDVRLQQVVQWKVTEWRGQRGTTMMDTVVGYSCALSSMLSKPCSSNDVWVVRSLREALLRNLGVELIVSKLITTVSLILTCDWLSYENAKNRIRVNQTASIWGHCLHLDYV